MHTRYNPFTRNIEVSDFSAENAASLLNILVQYKHTSEDMVVYFGPNGSDVTGDGSQNKPFATYDHTMDSIPENIDHKVCVKGKAGTYTSTRYQDRRRCSPTGQFILECEDPPVRVAGPHTITTATEINTAGENSGIDIYVNGAGWTPDGFYRKFIRILTGDYAGCVSPIYQNTATHIYCPFDGYSTPAPGDTFEILEPAMNIIWSRAPVFTWDGSVGRGWSQYAIANISFQVPDMDINAETDWYEYEAYIWNGSGNVVMGIVEFYGDKAWQLFEMIGGSINVWTLPDPTQMANASLLEYWDETYGIYNIFPSVQFVARETPPTSEDWQGIVVLTGSSSGGEYTPELHHFSNRQGVGFFTSRGGASYFMTSIVEADHRSTASVACGYIAAIQGTMAVKIDTNSTLDLNNIYIASSLGAGVSVTDLSRSVMWNVRGDAASIATYGLYVGVGCFVQKKGTTDLTGVSGAIRFFQTSTTVTWPTAKSAQTDSRGSFVIA